MDGQKNFPNMVAGWIGRNARGWGSMQEKGVDAGDAFSCSCVALAGKPHGGEFCRYTVRPRWSQGEVRDIYLV